MLEARYWMLGTGVLVLKKGLQIISILKLKETSIQPQASSSNAKSRYLCRREKETEADIK